MAVCGGTHSLGTLRGSAPYTFAVGLLSAMLADFTHSFPEVQLTLDIDYGIVNIAAEEIDLAIVLHFQCGQINETKGEEFPR
jgi:DNA-binding transcriptional LysR family regulator